MYGCLVYHILSYSFGSILYHFIYGCVFCVLLFDFVNFGISRHRWEDNIKVDLQAVGFGGVDRMELAQDKNRWLALVNAVMNLRVP